MYISTRGDEKLTASKAILKGLSSKGGLFLPESLGKIKIDEKYLKKSYNEVAFDVLKLFLDDFTDDEIKYAVNSAYDKVNFPSGAVGFKTFGNLSFLELFLGPTLAFKDMALTMLPYLMETAKKKNGENRKSLILVATSGDTGGAALSSFKKSGEFDTVVLYPHGGVSEIQEKQMLYYTDARTRAFAVDGNFDDCQTFVKQIFSGYDVKDVILSSANSINIGRLVPQVIYYVYAYISAVNAGVIALGEQINVVVPTGNFGDIFAGYLAKKIGVPLNKFVCASNVNNVLTDFFKTGVYDKNREFYKSNSPAMDILISSNLERLLYYATGSANRVNELMRDLKTNGKYKLTDSERKNLSEFYAAYSTEEETLKAINRAYSSINYLIDPHTAVAYDCYDKSPINGEKAIIISTASPFKFPYTVAKALNMSVAGGEVEIIKRMGTMVAGGVPYGIKKLLDSDKPTVVKTKEEIKDIVEYKKMSFTVKVPVTTANLGSAFDSAGVALNAYNVFKFEKAEKDELVGFNGGDITKNLVLISYKKLFEQTGRDYIPVKITMLENEAPSSRGLGSSATCIVAGVLGANNMLKNAYKPAELLKVMTILEGHPDNVAPCYLGGMVLSFVAESGEIMYAKYRVDDSVKFTAFIPPFELSTRKAREVLPKSVDFKAAVYNLSRAAVLGKAFETGDFELIKGAVQDKLHESYRYPLIRGGEQLKAELQKQGYAVTISGAGPTILAIGKTYANAPLNSQFEAKPLAVDNFGAKVY